MRFFLILFIILITFSCNGVGEETSENDVSSNISPPNSLKSLCNNEVDLQLVSNSGQIHIFRKTAASLFSCSDGLWNASENARLVPDTASFYFDSEGILLDICNPLYWDSGCTRFNDLTCQETNYCSSD